MARIALWFGRALEAASIALLAALLGVVVAAVVLRALGRSLGWYDEVASVLLVWLTYFGAALAALKRAHLGFPELVRALPRAPRLALFALAEVVVIGFFAVVTLYGWRVLDAVAFDTLASLPFVSQAVVQSIIPIGGVLFLCAELLSLPSAMAVVRAGIDVEAQTRETAIREAQASASAEGRSADAPAMER